MSGIRNLKITGIGHMSKLTLEKRISIRKWLTEGIDLSEIARRLSSTRSIIKSEITINGGRINYDPNKAQIKSENHEKMFLTLKDRKIIEESIKEGVSCVVISYRIGKSDSCVAKEIKRNGGKENYNAIEAHTKFAENIGKGNRARLRKFTEEELKKIETWRAEGRSKNWICIQLRTTETVFNRHFPTELRFVKQSELDKVEYLQMQIQILTDQLKELYDNNLKNK